MNDIIYTLANGLKAVDRALDSSEGTNKCQWEVEKILDSCISDLKVAVKDHIYDLDTLSSLGFKKETFPNNETAYLIPKVFLDLIPVGTELVARNGFKFIYGDGSEPSNPVATNGLLSFGIPAGIVNGGNE